MSGLNHSSSFDIYGHENEDISHALRDCLATKDVWKLLVPNDQQNKFFSDPFQIWFSTNLCYLVCSQEHGVMWASLFGLIIWRIWKNRNLFIFQYISWPSIDNIRAFLSWARQFEAIQNFSKLSALNPYLKEHSNEMWVHLFLIGLWREILGKHLLEV